MKICSGCKKKKIKSEFFRNKTRKDGLSCYCKDCRKQISLKWNNNNPESQKKWAENNKEKRCTYTRRWMKNNPKKDLVHRKFHCAIKSGKIKKLPCCECGNKKSEAHHPDYNKPLDVIWLCRLHHKKIHRSY